MAAEVSGHYAAISNSISDVSRRSAGFISQRSGAAARYASTHMRTLTQVKTVQILISDQPHISKWWWMGVILKMRRP